MICVGTCLIFRLLRIKKAGWDATMCTCQFTQQLGFPSLDQGIVMKKSSFAIENLENRQFRFEPKSPYDLVAERRLPRREALTFPEWYRHGELSPRSLI